MRLLGPQHVEGDGFEVYVHDRYHIAYKDDTDFILIPAEFGNMMISLHGNGLLNARDRRPVRLGDAASLMIRERVSGALVMMGENCGWVI